MNKFNREFGEMVIYYIKTCPHNDAEEWVKEKTRVFHAAPYTDAQLYDFIAEVSKIPVYKMESPNENICIGDISSFLQVLCSINNHYIRPEGGVLSELDLKTFTEQLDKDFKQ
jgi:hypothetical protein